jgi:hypothetical protein
VINILVRAFLSGFFLFNSIPHLVKGITGQIHMTPFKRQSSPILNIVWAFINLVIGVYVLGLGASWPLGNLTGTDFWAFILGGFVVSVVAASLKNGPNARLPWHKD